MAFVLMFDERSGGKTIRGGELWRADQEASACAAGVCGVRLADAKAILAYLQAELVASQIVQVREGGAACEQ